VLLHSYRSSQNIFSKTIPISSLLPCLKRDIQGPFTIIIDDTGVKKLKDMTVTPLSSLSSLWPWSMPPLPGTLCTTYELLINSFPSVDFAKNPLLSCIHKQIAMLSDHQLMQFKNSPIIAA